VTTSLDPRARRAAGAFAQVAAIVAAIALAVSLLGSCAGERPTLGSLPPSVPSTAAGASSTTTTAVAPPPAVDGVLGTADLLGWIATPTGDPEVYDSASEESERLDIGPTTSAGAPTTFAIVGDASPEAALPVPGWYEVALPTRPNGSTGWVPASSVTVARTPFRIFVELGGRTLRVEQDGVGVFTTEVAIGTDENPTPINGTYVTELIENTEPDGAYGPYAFGLAMHSDTLTEFNGGPGQVGIHGTNQPDLIGQAVSHGCVRLSNGDVQELVDLQLPLGVPVFITA
jgi:lipoprotein-anchoring transpeptidase ErfK/SrfK